MRIVWLSGTLLEQPNHAPECGLPLRSLAQDGRYPCHPSAGDPFNHSLTKRVSQDLWDTNIGAKASRIAMLNVFRFSFGY